jgi:hypothetical protein
MADVLVLAISAVACRNFCLYYWRAMFGKRPESD